MYSDDPHRDADAFDRRQSRWLRQRPICWACREPIQEDTCLSWHGHKYHHDCQDEWANDIASEFTEPIF